MEARAGCSELFSAILLDNSFTSPSVHGRFSGPLHLNLLFCPCDAAENSPVAFIAWAGCSDRRSSYVGDGHLSVLLVPVFSVLASPSGRTHFPVPSQ
jgi:hypothetical protein